MGYEAIPPNTFLPTLDLPYKPQLKPVGRTYWYGVDYRPSRTSEMSVYPRRFPDGSSGTEALSNVLSQVE